MIYVCVRGLVVNKELLTRHRIYEQVVDKDLPLCMPDISEMETLGALYMPTVRVGLIEASLVYDIVRRDRLLVSVEKLVQH
jgi:hypothetical protein